METIRINPRDPVEPSIIEMGLPPIMMELYFIFGKYGIFPPFFIGTGGPEDIHNYEIEHGGEHILKNPLFLLSKKENKPFILTCKAFLFSEFGEWMVRLETLKAGLIIIEKEKGTLFSFPNRDIELDYLNMLIEEYFEALSNMVGSS